MLVHEKGMIHINTTINWPILRNTARLCSTTETEVSLEVKRRERKDTTVVIIQSLKSEECDKNADKHKQLLHWFSLLYYIILYQRYTVIFQKGFLPLHADEA